MAKSIPEGYQSVTAHLVVRGCDEAMRFYGRAFGASEMFRMAGPDGGIMHAEMRIGGSVVMLADEMPQWNALSPLSVGGTSTVLHLYVEDCDAVFERAVAAGATSIMPPADMFWGDRYGKLRDPFGHEWSVATHVEDVSPEEMARRGEAAMKEMCGAAASSA